MDDLALYLGFKKPEKKPEKKKWLLPISALGLSIKLAYLPGVDVVREASFEAFGLYFIGLTLVWDWYEIGLT